MQPVLEFERPIAELEARINDLRHAATTTGEASEHQAGEEIARLERRLARLLQQTYRRLTPWNKVQVARHPDRPHSLDYIASLVEDFTPLAGDRVSGEDQAIVGGIGRFCGYSAVVLGHEKGHDAASRLRHNAGMAGPQGYRKASRLMCLADGLRLPVVTLIDTPGASLGVDADGQGQAAAIAGCIEISFKLRVPLVSVVIGEGGSAGAMALAAADKLLMLEHAVFAAASPERCAALLWDDGNETKAAAEALKLTAQDLHAEGIVDVIVPEPVGGAHRAREAAVTALGGAVRAELDALCATDGAVLRRQRRERFLRMTMAKGD